jgi:hypothetical protein
MVRILLYIKHNLNFIWLLIEWLNGKLFILLHGRKFTEVLNSVINEYSIPGAEARLLKETDLQELSTFSTSQGPARFIYFKPHGFDMNSLRLVYRNPAFKMMGVFNGSQMTGYFFLRCFWNSKCFVGRIVHKDYEGRGIGKLMNNIMYQTAWRSGFRCLSTISKNNHSVMNAHANNKTLKVLKELDNDYLFVEFLEKE